MNIEELCQRTGIARNEIRFLEGLATIYNDFPTLRSSIVIGGLAGKLLIDPEYTGSVQGITDIDLYLSKLPETLREHVRESALTESLNSAFGTLSTQRLQYEQSKFTCYKLQTGFDYAIDLFAGSIANIKLPEPAPALEFSLYFSGRLLTVKVAHPATLLGMYLQPCAITDKRMNRARRIVDSLGRRNPLLSGVGYQQVIKGLADFWRYNGFRPEQLEESMKHIERKYARRTTELPGIVEKAIEKL